MSDKSARDPEGLLRQLRNEHHTLSREHAEVKERVREYTSRRYLSPGEELECRMLQRLKLHKKDALAALERRLYALEGGVVAQSAS